jgi:hypothetical protein
LAIGSVPLFEMKTYEQDRIVFTPPMECLPVNGFPESPDWVYELKLDGFRGQAIRDNRGVGLLSRNGKDFSKKFPQVVAALAEALPMGTAVDGELVAFDETGHLSFNAIQNASADANIVFFVFDVLVNRWRDVKQLPLNERLTLLQSAFTSSDRVQLSQYFPGPVSRFITAVRQMGGDGVVAKRLSSRYESGKVHCLGHYCFRRQEFDDTRKCPRFCVNAVPLVSASWFGAGSFLLVTLMPRIVGIIWLAGAAVKAERSEFISSLDGGPRQPYRFLSGA